MRKFMPTLTEKQSVAVKCAAVCILFLIGSFLEWLDNVLINS